MDGTNYTVNNIFAIIGGDAYFPVEEDTNVQIRAHNEYTGGTPDDQAIAATGDYAARLSPMASYMNYSSEGTITLKTFYFTYAGNVNGGGSTSTTDTTSTVRLRAANANCDLDTLWEFDTGIHGVGTAPAVFDPSPGEPGDEIVYFAVIGTDDINLHSTTAMKNYPNSATENPEELYLYALVDTTGAGVSCPGSGSYRLKWTHPFPDPDVVEWTDYPTEEATGTNGQYPPYVRLAADITPFLPEEDLLFDYRDSTANDNTQNQVRGNLYMKDEDDDVPSTPSVSPPVVNVLYELSSGSLTTDRPSTADSGDPLIDIYLMYAAHSFLKNGDPLVHLNGVSLAWGNTVGLKKQSLVQTRVIALRDRLDGSCDSNGENCSWNWNSAQSRFPTFKWSYRVPAWDSKQNDARPWNGYGEYVWETWFEQHNTPMFNVVAVDQNNTAWASVTNGGQQNLYPVLYPAYESQGYLDKSGSANSIAGPTVAQGSPENFSGATWGTTTWDESHLLVMAIRDTWDDYIAGNATNAEFTNLTSNFFALASLSNPVEPYWTNPGHGDSSNSSTGYPTYPNSSENVIAYPNYTGVAATEGFPQPYAWWEGRWSSKVQGITTSSTRDLDEQGWSGSGSGASDLAPVTQDIDVEAETSAFCADCLDGDGLIVQVFNHDLSASLRDIRVHTINARTGEHVWDYHMPERTSQDYYNATPGVANNRVFVAYQHYGERKAFLQVFEADTGDLLQRAMIDDDADAIVLAPTIANETAYIATYDFNTASDAAGSEMDNDVIRLFAFSPLLRLLSTGIYPATTSLQLAQEDAGGAMELPSDRMPRAERKLQINMRGTGSKWEEVREVYQ
ncbi:hypothetical protein GF339_14880 [candidate division KSB3 bacterium]|uniref:Uncharacterized protein n=1 Tax=candidate division KSB3 bacterium TaxID=2044937 RepID=A0A9D5JX56_9BACT|nr:hypothetical protein [candidate division KSB3 bacterium]MBD3325868.1 hypothetical protein [candidate division KSB3 bacterium]